MKHSRIIFFDFDGVIVDTFKMAYQINSKMYPGLTEEEYRMRFIDKYFVNLHQADPENYRKMNDEFGRQYSPLILKHRPLHTIDQILDGLQQEYILYIISSTPTAAISQFLGFFNLLNYFSDVLGGDIHASKHEKFNQTITSHHTDPQSCIFITDTVGDIVEAKEANIASIAVCWGYHSKDMLLKANPDYIVEDPGHLIGTITDYYKGLPN